MALSDQIIGLLVLLLLSGFFSGSEVALFSMSRIRIRHLLKQKSKGAIYVGKLKEDPDRLLSTILIGNNLVNVGASVLATIIAFSLFESYAISIATGGATLLLLIFGEITPKSFAAKYAERFALIVARPIWALSIFFYPIIKMLKFLLSPINPKTKRPSITEEELKSYAEVGLEEGSIKELEKKMIHRIFEFDNISVSEIMTPKVEMSMVNANDKISNVIKRDTKKLYSRLPVFIGGKDNIVGILNVKDIIKSIDGKKKSQKVEKYMRKPMFVPESKKIDTLLRLFQKKNEHMAIVVNEHGSVTGLATIENVIEELVGEIKDETDILEPHITSLGKDAWRVKGKTSINDLKEKIGFDFKPGDYDTFNGFVANKLGRFPKKGEEFRHGKFSIKIEEMKGHRVELARVSKSARRAK